MSEPTLEQTMEFVSALFHGVTDKAGEPYDRHCFRVMMGLPKDASAAEKHAALLHDVFEDTDVIGADLLQHGYSQEIVDLVTALTKSPAESYTAYISRLAGSPAERIKRSDLADNSDTARLVKLPEQVRSRLAVKYSYALSILNFASNANPPAGAA